MKNVGSVEQNVTRPTDKVQTLSPAVIKEMCLSGSLTLDAFALETELHSICVLVGRGGMLWYSETLLPSICLVYSRAIEMAHCLGWDEFNAVLRGERLYPLRDVLFLLYPHVSDSPFHPTVEISPLGWFSPPHRCLCDSGIKADRAIYSDTGWPQEHTGSYHLEYA